MLLYPVNDHTQDSSILQTKLRVLVNVPDLYRYIKTKYSSHSAMHTVRKAAIGVPELFNMF